MKKRVTFSIKSLCVTAFFSAVICVFSFITIPLPFTSIPLTMGLVAIFITATVLPPHNAVYAVAVYILLGTMGLPVFSSFRGGIEPLVSYTGGYIWGYLPLTLVCALFAGHFEKKFSGKKLSFMRFTGIIIGLSICYCCGAVQFAAVMNVGLKKAVAATILPFIPFDILKAAMAVVISGRIKKIINKVT